MQTHSFPVIARGWPTRRFTRLAATAAAIACAIGLSLPAQAQSEASVALSMLPTASVVGSAVVALPVALSVGGATLGVVAIEASADGTVYVLERLSDGARVSLQVAGRAAGGVSVGVGTVIMVSAIGTGIILSTAGRVLAFLPNAMGHALLHNESLS